MKDEVVNIIKTASIYAATIIGAGFASGQEIMSFFSTYEKGGFYGILLAGLLFSVIGYVVLDKIYREKINNYEELVFPLLGWGMGWVMEILVSLFMLCVFFIMIVGMGSVLSDKTAIPFSIAVPAAAILSMLGMLWGIKGIVNLSTAVTPLLIIGIVVSGIYVIASHDASVFSPVAALKSLNHNWLSSAINYVSYNSIMSVAVLSKLLPYLKTRRTGRIAGMAGGMILCLMTLILNTAIFKFYPEILPEELPVLVIMNKYSYALANLYSIVLWLAMYISAITSGYFFAERLSGKTGLGTVTVSASICALALPLSGLGFSSLITVVYPIFGYAGLFIMAALLLQTLSNRFGKKRQA